MFEVNEETRIPKSEERNRVTNHERTVSSFVIQISF